MTTPNHRNDKWLTEQVAAGLSDNQIATAALCSPDSVRDRVKKLEIKRPFQWAPSHDHCGRCLSQKYPHFRNGVCVLCADQLSPAHRGLLENAHRCECCWSEVELVVREFERDDQVTMMVVCKRCGSQQGGTKHIARWCGRRHYRIPQAIQDLTSPQPINMSDKAGAKATKVAILGANGFVGKNLCEHLADSYKIIPGTRAECDAMEMSQVRAFINRHKPDVVIDLAAFVGGIGLNKDNPGEMIYKNLVMSVNVVEACYALGVRKLIYLGSVCSYPHTPQHIPFREIDMWWGRPERTNEPYGVAKKTIGLMLDAYNRQYNFASAYLIPTNMYGPWDDFSLYASHVIPAMIRKFTQAVIDGVQEVNLWGDGSPTREFLYVGDCCEAIKLAIEKIDEPIPINVGTGIETTMLSLAANIAQMVGFRGKINWDDSKPNGQPRRCLDIEQARTQLGYAPKTQIAVGLRKTIDWYNQHQ